MAAGGSDTEAGAGMEADEPEWAGGAWQAWRGALRSLPESQPQQLQQAVQPGRRMHPVQPT
eukprot:7216588-Lingulodinium_polyedra.AAC.1